MGLEGKVNSARPPLRQMTRHKGSAANMVLVVASAASSGGGTDVWPSED